MSKELEDDIQYLGSHNNERAGRSGTARNKGITSSKEGAVTSEDDLIEKGHKEKKQTWHKPDTVQEGNEEQCALVSNKLQDDNQYLGSHNNERAEGGATAGTKGFTSYKEGALTLERT